MNESKLLPGLLVNPAELEKLFDRLWPICRSITGDGLRESLHILSEVQPMRMHEIPSGSRVFDWEVPKEWNIREAWIKGPDGKMVCDFRENNLHVVNYSSPIKARLPLSALKAHLHSIPSMPEAIPYLTTYYKENWGFCLRDNVKQSLPEGEYEVFIDTELKAGSMSYGEIFLPGRLQDEILFSTYVCHPSMANNELSGPLAAIFLAREIAAIPERKYSYRFVFLPETIGAIALLHRLGTHFKEHLKAGYVLTCCGDRGDITYKHSKRGDSLADRAALNLLEKGQLAHRGIPFAVGGSDERQYCSPGFNLPVGSIMRTPYQQFAEYHTSADNKDFISFDQLQETIRVCLGICQILELNESYQNSVAFCEPQLGKRGLYPSSVDPKFDRENLHRLLHFLAFADGNTDVISIANHRNDCALQYADIVKQCREAGLI
jgi:aminopeptidase-like protein